jgi:hypothetical protein
VSGTLIAETRFAPPSHEMSAEKRRNPRRTVTYPAFLDLGDGLPARECTLCDASQEGAQLAVAQPNSLPDQFVLALSSDRAVRRRCGVIWRTETQVGVKFLKDRKAKPTARVRMGLNFSPVSQATESREPVTDPTDIDKLTPR